MAPKDTLPNILRPTTVVDSPRLRDRLGLDLFLVSETLQYTGSFKFRAAYNLASRTPQPHILTASSGNFGQAVAYACRLLGKRCTVVMPATSARVKVEAVREYGGVVDLVDVREKTREQRVTELARDHPEAYVASAYNDPLVIQGNATLGAEIAALDRPVDVIVAPVGGGGLTSGLVTGVRPPGRAIQVVGAEPLLANDAARSFREGTLVRSDVEAETIADGARTLSLGSHNWEILKTGLSRIVEVPEDAIREAVRLLFSLANLKAEPTGALSLAALLTEPEPFRGRAVCCVISGGNVDPALYAQLIAD